MKFFYLQRIYNGQWFLNTFIFKNYLQLNISKIIDFKFVLEYLHSVVLKKIYT